jgi:hypothetical protein
MSISPMNDNINLIGDAGADYVGFDDDGYVNDDTVQKEQSAVAMAVYGSSCNGRLRFRDLPCLAGHAQ